MQGSATGIGVTLLLHCDLVYADGRCVFKTPFASIGIVPEFGASYMGVRMLRKVTWTRLFVLGEDVAARDMGEVCEVVDGGRDVVEYVKRVCGKWVDGMGEIEWKATENAKRVIRASVREGCEKAMERVCGKWVDGMGEIERECLE